MSDWPLDVPAPGAPGWVRAASAFLLDSCPPDYRAHPVMTRQPAVLGWLAVRHADANAETAVQSLAQARVALHGLVDPPTIAALVGVLESEAARLRVVSRACRQVASALLEASGRGGGAGLEG
jgi:hypothetical protein